MPTFRGSAALSIGFTEAGADAGLNQASAKSWLAQHSYRPMASAEYQDRNAEFAMKARQDLPVLSSIDDDLFLKEVLPYQHFDEPLDEWRPDFYTKLIDKPGVKEAATIKELAETVIPMAFTSLGNTVEFKANFTPEAMAPISETIRLGHASCTGLSILVANALRSVGVPARIAGVAEWNRADGGNHNWVEVWTGDGWHFIDAAPQTVVTWDKAWFANGLVQQSVAKGIHGVYTPVWDAADADANYTVTWREQPVLLPALERTMFYKAVSTPASADADLDQHVQLAEDDLHARHGAKSSGWTGMRTGAASLLTSIMASTLIH